MLSTFMKEIESAFEIELFASVSIFHNNRYTENDRYISARSINKISLGKTSDF